MCDYLKYHHYDSVINYVHQLVNFLNPVKLAVVRKQFDLLLVVCKLLVIINIL